MLYRILTVNETPEQQANITRAMASRFHGFTLQPVTGYWNGELEHSIAIEVATDDRAAVTAAADDIRRDNLQDSVLVEEIPAWNCFVTAQHSCDEKFRPAGF